MGTAAPSAATKSTSKRGRLFRGPRWARVCAVFGALLMMVSGGLLVTGEMLLARYEGAVRQENLFGGDAQPKSDIKGPLNLLLVGIDPRPSNPTALPLADSVLIMHIPASMDAGYLFSLPRDLLVDIPAFPKANYPGGRDRLNASMSHGSVVPGRDIPSPVQGFQLLSQTVSNYTGIQRFDAGAIINFNGFKRIVDAMGGVTMYIEQDLKSEHLQPDGSPRPKSANLPKDRPYYGPQKQYTKGTHHLKGWEALDYVRQRYNVVGGDYGRQKHQQQFIRAMVSQAMSKDVVTNPIKLDKVVRAAGESLIFDGRGHRVIDFALALRNIRADSIINVKLQGGGAFNANRVYIGENLQPVAAEFFAAVNAGTVDTFLISHPDLISS